MARARAGCRRHRSALTAFAAHREAAPETRPALDHVDRCRACADELQELVLAVIALRRLGELPEPAAISSAAWPRLRDRIERTRASAAALAWRSRTTLAGMAAGTLLVAAIVAPLALNVPLGDTSAEPAGDNSAELDLINGQVEHRYIVASRAGSPSPASLAITSPTPGTQFAIPRRYPDGIAREGKEVDERPTMRPPAVD